MVGQQRHRNVKGSCWRHHQGYYFFKYTDIKQGIVHTLLMEEHNVSKEWVIIIDRRQDSNATSTLAGKSVSSAEDPYCSDLRGGDSDKKRCGNEEE